MALNGLTAGLKAEQPIFMFSFLPVMHLIYSLKLNGPHLTEMPHTVNV
jgi:hypothetical protein